MTTTHYEISYAYPGSINAKRYGLAASGAWLVNRVDVPDGACQWDCKPVVVAGFGLRSEARDYVDKLTMIKAVKQQGQL